MTCSGPNPGSQHTTYCRCANVQLQEVATGSGDETAVLLLPESVTLCERPGKQGIRVPDLETKGPRWQKESGYLPTDLISLEMI